MNILVVEDEPLTLKVVEYVLSGSGYQVTKATNIKEADEILSLSQPWLAIVDKFLPDGNGADYCELLAEKHPGLPVILLTCESQQRQRDYMRYPGDTIRKPFVLKDLVDSVKRMIRADVACHAAPPAQSRLTVGEIELAPVERRLYISNKPTIQLSKSESKLLECVMSNAGAVVTTEELDFALHAYDLTGEVDSVDEYIYRLRRKLEDDPNNPRYLCPAEKLGMKGYFFSKELPVMVVE
ncbi:MAG: response regulator transcription factor [Chloroflexi bacterium]|uniref:Response regulator transcription factor n=1 Tax=Candidatus Chlorohelix allophototropha TaxID=3003348 RepID=A0A8T7M9W0_9CHLR|nr:response regulator transcription factor [Chloroflexota bacterium]WJW68846.1 response regulator transcription factor [Chloroflexota bacterium L227-S17]